MATPTSRGGGSVSWQRVPLSRLALPVNRDCSAVILYSAVISIIMHCTSRLTGHARRDNGTHCQDTALRPPRRVGVAVYYVCVCVCVWVCKTLQSRTFFRLHTCNRGRSPIRLSPRLQRTAEIELPITYCPLVNKITVIIF